MAVAATPTARPGISDELQLRRRVIRQELRYRALWFVRLRWWVPVAIGALTGAAYLAGLETPVAPLLAVAVLIALYNSVFHLLRHRIERAPDEDVGPVRLFTVCQMGLDYAAMFLLIHHTGGVASPLAFFAIFHVIFAALLLPRRSALGFAALVVLGMVGIGLSESSGVLTHHPLVFHGQVLDFAHEPFPLVVTLLCYAAVMLITSLSTTAIAAMLRQRIVALADLSEQVVELNERLRALHDMTQAIVRTRSIDDILHLVTSELASVIDVEATSVELLSEDRASLRCTASFGLPPDLVEGCVVEVARSSLSRRILEGEPFVTGDISSGDSFQLSAELSAAGLRSAILVPLAVGDRVIGILGAYCSRADCFQPEHVTFLRMAADLVAIAVENGRAYQAVEEVAEERSRFMLRIAHDLRSPLAAIVSMVEILRGDYKGQLNPDQVDCVARIDRRARTMLDMINELMTLAKSRSRRKLLDLLPVDVGGLAGRLTRAFRDAVKHKSQRLEVSVARGTPPILGDEKTLEELLENLVSNAVKYTPEGGQIAVRFASEGDDLVRVEVRDSGIGISKQDQAKLFTEFFRAENARQLEGIGTGLGLALVKEMVVAHGGTIEVDSEPGRGSVFTVRLPRADDRFQS